MITLKLDDDSSLESIVINQQLEIECSFKEGLNEDLQAFKDCLAKSYVLTPGFYNENDEVVSTIWDGSLPSTSLLDNWKTWITTNPDWKFHVIYDSDLLTSQQIKQFKL